MNQNQNLNQTLSPRCANESWVEMVEAVMPAHTNLLHTLFGGQLMAWIDTAAALCAARHSRNICVTASIDALHFLKPISLGWIVILKAAVNFTGQSSMEIGVRVEAENPITGEFRHTTSAFLTFVALNSTGQRCTIPPLKIESTDDKRRWTRAEERRKNRLLERSQKIENA